MPPTVADAIVQRLKQHGVRHIFGYPGGQITPLYDALARRRPQTACNTARAPGSLVRHGPGQPSYQSLPRTPPSHGSSSRSQVSWETPRFTARTLPSAMATFMA